MTPVPPLPLRYPAAERLDLVERLHGHSVADPYRWLEDAGDARTIAWSKAQDALARSYLDALPGRQPLAAHLRALLQVRSRDPPLWRGRSAFWTERAGDQQHAVLWTAMAAGGGDNGHTDDPAERRPLLDPAALERLRSRDEQRADSAR